MKPSTLVTALVAGIALSTVPVFAKTTVSVAGSTAMLPLVKAAAVAYEAAHPSVAVEVSGGGSTAGINMASAKAIDIGDSDILAPNRPELVDNVVAVTGFAVITNPSVTVKNLTRKQIQDIFSGKLENWKQVGGPDQRIVLVNRTHGSGTRVVFERTLLAPAVGSDTGLTEDATGAAVAVVKQTPGAISYAAFSGTHRGGVNEVSIDGVAPTDANVITGKYPFWSYEHMFTAGPAAGEAKKFIDFISSNGELIHRNGFIKVSDMKVKGRLFRHHGLPDCC